MVSDRLKACFCHIPKTAGRSIEAHCGCTQLRRLYKDGPIIDPRWHAPAREYDPWVEKGYLLFTVVRNPWDRLVSLNHFITGHGRAISTANLIEQIEQHQDDHEPPHLWSPSQEAWIGDRVDRLRILRFENLAEEWALLAAELGEKPTLPRRNVSAQRLHYREYFAAPQIEWVEKNCAWEIERFGYRF